MTDDLTPVDDTLIVDRSTLQRFASCPLQGRLCDTVYRSAGSAAASGTEAHEAVRRAVQTYIDSNGCLSKGDLAEEIWNGLRESRPDVQPDAIAGLRASVWAIAGYLSEIHYTNILRHDGGEGKRSGQLAFDLTSLPVRVTAEVDFLHATESRQVLALLDWKTGHKYWTETDVSRAFQFQMLGFLVLENYPEVECVRTSIWNTRSNSKTYAVEFTRDRMTDYRMRISTAAAEWFRWREADPAMVPAWPARDKCDTCSAVSGCLAADRDLAEKPEDQLRGLSLLTERTKAVTKRLTAIVKATGRDITCDGIAFGHFGKVSKPKDGIYSVGGSDDE